jgi:hypothetical protein
MTNTNWDIDEYTNLQMAYSLSWLIHDADISVEHNLTLHEVYYGVNITKKIQRVVGVIYV